MRYTEYTCIFTNNKEYLSFFFVERAGNTKGRGALLSFSPLVRACVLEISPFALNYRRPLRRLQENKLPTLHRSFFPDF